MGGDEQTPLGACAKVGNSTGSGDGQQRPGQYNTTFCEAAMDGHKKRRRPARPSASGNTPQSLAGEELPALGEESRRVGKMTLGHRFIIHLILR